MAQRLIPPHRQTFMGLDNAQLIRLFDILLCVLILPWLIPILLVVSAAVKLTSPGPVFFRSKRVGKNEQLFAIYKFRTMVRIEKGLPLLSKMIRALQQSVVGCAAINSMNCPN